jgi:hypothetical protein
MSIGAHQLDCSILLRPQRYRKHRVESVGIERQKPRHCEGFRERIHKSLCWLQLLDYSS